MKKILGLVLIVAVYGCDTEKVQRDRLFIQGNEALSNRAYDQAIAYYDKAITIDNNFTLAYNNRGVAKIEDDRPFEAIQDYNFALSRDPQYHEALFNRAYAYEQVGRVTDALDDIISLKKIYPDSAYIYYYKGLLETRLRDYDAAMNSFSESLSRDIGNLETSVNIATLHFFRGELDSAKDQLKIILARNPFEANALNTMSQIYLEEQDLQNALLTINKALDIVPNEPYFINNRGQVFLEMNDLDQALKEINRSILLDPSNAWAYRNKGIYYLKKGDPKKALKQFERAASEEVFIDQLYVFIGQAYRELGQLDKACESLRKALDVHEKVPEELLEDYCG